MELEKNMNNEEINKLRKTMFFYDVYFHKTGENTSLGFEKARVSPPTNVDGKDVVLTGDDKVIDLTTAKLEDFFVCMPLTNPVFD